MTEKKEYVTDNKQIKDFTERILEEFKNSKEIMIEEHEDGSITFTPIGKKEDV